MTKTSWLPSRPFRPEVARPAHGPGPLRRFVALVIDGALRVRLAGPPGDIFGEGLEHPPRPGQPRPPRLLASNAIYRPKLPKPPKAPRRVGSSDGPASDSFIRPSLQIVPLADARAWSPIGVLAPGPGPSFRGPSRMFERRSSADGRPRPVDVSGKTGRAFSASGGERLRALKKKLRLKWTKRHNT